MEQAPEHRYTYVTGMSPEDRAKAGRAFDQFERREIDGVLLTRGKDGKVFVKRMPKVLED